MHRTVRPSVGAVSAHSLGSARASRGRAIASFVLPSIFLPCSHLPSIGLPGSKMLEVRFWALDDFGFVASSVEDPSQGSPRSRAKRAAMLGLPARSLNP